MFVNSVTVMTLCYSNDVRLVSVLPYLDLGDATPRGEREVRDLPRCNNPDPCGDELYSASLPRLY